MTARSKGSIAFLVLSILLLITGVIMSVLIYELIRTAIDMADQIMESKHEQSYISPSAYQYSPSISVLGGGYFVPAVLGIIAVACHKKAAYIVHMIFSIISLVVMGIFFIVGLFALSVMATHKSMDCINGPNGCMCKEGGSYSDYTDMGLKDCGVLYDVYHLAVGIISILVINWILMLTCTVLSGVEACRSTQNQPGTVIIREVPQTTFVRLEETGAPPAYVVHDQAVLVKNQLLVYLYGDVSTSILLYSLWPEEVKRILVKTSP